MSIVTQITLNMIDNIEFRMLENPRQDVKAMPMKKIPLRHDGGTPLFDKFGKSFSTDPYP
jgi:hypothetical protein